MGFRLAPGLIADLSDDGEAIVGGKKWHWTFHDYLGPTFTDETGEPLERQPGANHRVWKAFEKWLTQRNQRKRIIREFRGGERDG